MKERQYKTPKRQWGSIIYRCRWAVAIAWVFFIVVLGAFAVRTPSLLQDSGFTPTGSQSERGIAFLEENLDMSAASLDIVLQSTEGKNLTASEAQDRIWEELAPLRDKPFVQDMYASMVTRKAGEDGIISYTVLLNETASEALKHFDEIKAAVPEIAGTETYIRRQSGGLSRYERGRKARYRPGGVVRDSGGACYFAAPVPDPSRRAAVVVIGVGSVAATMGGLYFVAANGAALSNFLPNMVTMLGLAVGIDYALFMVSRFREELAERTSPTRLRLHAARQEDRCFIRVRPSWPGSLRCVWSISPFSVRWRSAGCWSCWCRCLPQAPCCLRCSAYWDGGFFRCRSSLAEGMPMVPVTAARRGCGFRNGSCRARASSRPSLPQRCSSPCCLPCK